MSEELEMFLKERRKIPIPSGDVARVKLLAKELALGVHRGLWFAEILVARSYSDIVELRSGDENNLQPFIERRWGDKHKRQHLALLKGHSYLADIKGNYDIAPTAFALLSEAPPYRVFISYMHEESSAFALLLVNKLKHYGIQPFCDMSLVPGEDWHPELEKQIMKCEHFIVLVGKQTRNSRATVKEVKWALENDKIVIPIWHNGFELKLDEWHEIDDDVVKAIERKHAVIVEKESANGYNAAITELLTNRFGVTP